VTYTDDVISELQETINGLEATVNSLRADLTASRGFSADLGKVIDRMEGEAKDLKAEATAATRTAARWEQAHHDERALTDAAQDRAEAAETEADRLRDGITVLAHDLEVTGDAVRPHEIRALLAPADGSGS